MTYFDIDSLDTARTYKLLTSTVVPRPIAWLISKNGAGELNAAPFSFFNYFAGRPPVIVIGIGNRSEGRKDSLNNLLETREFVVNMVPIDLVPQMNATAVDFPPEVDELAAAGLATVPCVKVGLPRVAASPVALECRLWQTIEIGPNNHLVLGHVLAVHVADEAVSNVEKCYIDGSKLHLVGRLQSPGWYTRTDDRFLLKQMSVAQWEEAAATAVATPQT